VTIPESWFLILAAVIFGIGMFGLLTRRSALIMTFVTFSRSLHDIGGQASVFFILVVAAAEVTVGLAIVVAIFRRRQSTAVDELSELRG
jgi:NADH-quinone oxidoreductase subunit K